VRGRSLAAAAAAACCVALTVIAAPAHADSSPSPSAAVDDSTLLEPSSDSALLNLLGRQGVAYYPVSSAGQAFTYAGLDTTLVIGQSELPNGYDLSGLTSLTFGRVIVLDDDDATFNAFAPNVHFHTVTETTPAMPSPACAQTDAVAAGSISLTGTASHFLLDSSSGSVVGCYPVNGHPLLVYTSDGSTDAVALGSTTFFENDELASAGNAALALRLFGAHRKLVWLAPNFEPDLSLNNCGSALCDGGQGQNNPEPGSTTTIPPRGAGGATGAQRPTVASLMPGWIWWVLLQLVVTVLLVAYWRGRRLGAVVTEQLPVTVRAAETVEGHARLYRRADAHGRAAELLRRAAAGRLAGYVGVPAARAHADPSVLVAPLSARLGVTDTKVADLLVGGAPQSEAELVLLADHLDLLEQEVRSS
jgi:hypothetical protein